MKVFNKLVKHVAEANGLTSPSIGANIAECSLKTAINFYNKYTTKEPTCDGKYFYYLKAKKPQAATQG